jgi:putative two-component system response regulator
MILVKSGVTDSILLKPGKLTAEEIAYTHHEKCDGTGYPQALKGNAIPISGRLMAIADVYDALISKRVNKEALSHSEAVKIIKGRKGKYFDPELVEAFSLNN